MTLIERLQEYMTYKELNYNQITIQTGLSVGLIRKAIKANKGLHSESIGKILSTYNDLNPEWLLTGEGDMLKNAPYFCNANVPKLPKGGLSKEQQISFFKSLDGSYSEEGDRILIAMWHDFTTEFVKKMIDEYNKTNKTSFSLDDFKNLATDFQSISNWCADMVEFIILDIGRIYSMTCTREDNENGWVETIYFETHPLEKLIKLHEELKRMQIQIEGMMKPIIEKIVTEREEYVKNKKNTVK